MTYDDQVAALFAKANPVPSLDLLDPVELVDIADLVEPSKRSRVMIAVDGLEPKKLRRRIKPGWVIGVAAATVAVVVAGSLLNREPSLGAPEEVATAYIAAASAYDREAATELLAPDFADAFDEMAAWDAARTIGLTVESQGCEVLNSRSGSTPVRCPTLVETDLTRALDLEPATGTYRIVVDESGRIVTASFTMLDPGGIPEADDAFKAWVEENHPDDVFVMFERSADTPESLALWERYVDEYLASLAG